MSTHVTATFDIKSWDEKPYDEAEGLGKLTRVRAVYTYRGDVEGEGTSESLMTYQDGGTTTNFVSLERVVGRVAGRSGSFMLEGQGTYSSTEGAKSEFFVVPGSAAGELVGLRGKGNYVASQPPFSWKLDFAFE